MLENLTERFREAFKSITGQSKLTEDNVKDAVRAIKRALLEADVNLAVAKRFVDDVRDKALGAEVLSGVNPAQQFIKIVHDELVALMSDPSSRDDEGRVRINFTRSRPTVVLMAGLQGSGKTTTCAKLAALLVKRNKVKPLLVAADLQRPAAVEQLKVLGKQIGVDVYAEEKSTPPTVCRNALDFARKNANDLIILDTAGRLHVDEALMKEVSEIAKLTEPEEVLLVCDAMTGQDAVKSAKAFDERLPLTGVILTKLDGDARGGAALTVKAVTGKPIKFIGVGEKIEQLEEFFPDRMAGRILGMGDVVTLVEKAQSVIDEKTAVEMEHKLLADEFTMEDFLDQIEAIQKMGPIKDLMKMIPGAANLPMDQFDERGIVHLKALIQSMTVRERRFPDQLSNSRKVRIAKGSGRNVDELNKLLKGFDQMRKMVKAMSQQGILGRVAGYNIKRKRVKRLRNEAKGASK
ncbi:MAG: signal recognition particle protein, partial [Planctomycetes bacterium]|nr:signal recognition particle protein [Planctomycetota bacterium]